jgi:hypothetical protein
MPGTYSKALNGEGGLNQAAFVNQSVNPRFSRAASP